MYRYIAKEPLILASISPRRKELITSLGIPFSVTAPDCDEKHKPEESPARLVSRLSFEKADSVAAKNPSAWIVGADTVVVVDGEILGKPADKIDAKRMLNLISGRWHEVWGGVTLLNREKDVRATHALSTEVRMRRLGAREIDDFIASGEPMDKAGAYAVQEKGAGLVAEIAGSYTNVVGLNLSLLLEELSSNNVIEL